MTGKLEGGYNLSGRVTSVEKDLPKISVVTVTFNAEKHLRQTIESVLGQSYPNVEYIVVDGGSKDATVDIIREYEDRIAYWVSEQDSGIYDAMNKGILLATGELVGMKNADDWYLPDALLRVVNCYIKTCPTVIYGNSLHVVQEQPLLANQFVVNHHLLGFGPGLDHRSMFVKTAWHKMHLFDTRYRLAADYDLMLRLKDSGELMEHCQTDISYKRAGGASYAWKLIQELAWIDWRSGRKGLAFQRLTKDSMMYFGLKYGNSFLKWILGEQGYVRWKTRSTPRLTH